MSVSYISTYYHGNISTSDKTDKMEIVSFMGYCTMLFNELILIIFNIKLSPNIKYLVLIEKYLVPVFNNIVYIFLLHIPIGTASA